MNGKYELDGEISSFGRFKDSEGKQVAYAEFTGRVSYIDSDTNEACCKDEATCKILIDDKDVDSWYEFLLGSKGIKFRGSFEINAENRVPLEVINVEEMEGSLDKSTEYYAD